MAKRVPLLLLVFCLLLCLGQERSSAAPSPATLSAHDFVRLIIPEAQVWASVQVINQLPDGRWEEPNYVSAWVLAPYPGVFYLNRDDLGFRLDKLEPGSRAFLYRDWLMETDPVRLRVLKLEVIDASEEANVWGQVGNGIFAFVASHPAKDPTAPQRLVVWAVANAKTKIKRQR